MAANHSHFQNASKSLKWRGASPSSHSSFCEEVFSRAALQKVGDHRPPLQRAGTNELDRTNILAPGFWLRKAHLLPAFTPGKVSGIGTWEVVSSYSSATAPELHGISRADPLFQARKELDQQLPACASALKIYLSRTSLCARILS